MTPNGPIQYPYFGMFMDDRTFPKYRYVLQENKQTDEIWHFDPLTPFFLFWFPPFCFLVLFRLYST